MNILITGAAGLYGVHLVDAFLRKNNVKKVYAVDDFSREFLGDPFEFIEKHPNKGKFKLFKMDFADLNHVMSDYLDLDVVIHLAAYVSIPQSMDDPFPYFQNNEYGTFKLLQSLFKSKKRPFFIFASSPEVYGNPVYTPMRVDHPFNPRSVYATTKLAAEKHCLAMHQWYEYPCAIIRNFNTFGENQNTFKYAAVIPNFICRALRNEDIIIDQDGKQTRDFMYIKDAIKAYELLVEQRDKMHGRVFNIGTGVEVTINDLAKEIIDLTGSKSKVIHRPGRNADLSRLQADTTETQSDLGWKLDYSFRDGLKATIDWFKKKLEEEGKK